MKALLKLLNQPDEDVQQVTVKRRHRPKSTSDMHARAQAQQAGYSAAEAAMRAGMAQQQTAATQASYAQYQAQQQAQSPWRPFR